MNPITYEADKIDDIIQNEVDFVSTRLNAGNDHPPNYDTENCSTVQNENRSPYLEKLIDWENLASCLLSIRDEDGLKNRGIKLTLKPVSAFGEEHLEYLIICKGNTYPHPLKAGLE